MDTITHTLKDLFSQLGLPQDEEEARDFISLHRPLADETKLYQAHWWNPAQAAFLKEAIELDAEWAEAVDELDALLRHRELDDIYYE